MFLLPGTWKSLDDLESNLTSAELSELITTARNEEYKRMKFAAALKGIDLDEGQRNAEFEKVQARAEARLYGEGAGEARDLDGLINFVEEDE